MPVPSVSDAAFADEVLAAPYPVLVEFGAEWCAPCRAVEPIIEQLRATYAGRVRVRAVDADTALETVTRYGVRNIPTVLLFDNGQLVERVVGARSAGEYTQLLEKHLATHTPRVAQPDSAWQTPLAEMPLWAEAPPDASSHAAATALVDADEPLMVFKHSATCSISVSVKRQLDAFIAANPHLPTRVVVVQNERRLSDALAVVLQVRHESPQALLVQNGRLLWHASHRRITTDALGEAFRAASSTDTVV